MGITCIFLLLQSPVQFPDGLFYKTAIQAHCLKVVRVYWPEMVASSSAHLSHRLHIDKINSPHF